MSSKDDMSSEKTGGELRGTPGINRDQAAGSAPRVLRREHRRHPPPTDHVSRRRALDLRRWSTRPTASSAPRMRSRWLPASLHFRSASPSPRSTPWVFKQLTEKRVPVVFPSASDLPPEASVDLQTWRAFGVRSVAVFPIVAGDQLLGGVSFGTTLRELQWPQPMVDRLRLICEVFAGALLRREHERKLQRHAGRGGGSARAAPVGERVSPCGHRKRRGIRGRRR